MNKSKQLGRCAKCGEQESDCFPVGTLMYDGGISICGSCVNKWSRAYDDSDIRKYREDKPRHNKLWKALFEKWLGYRIITKEKVVFT